MNSSNRLFYRSKSRLAIAYASVMGGVLLLCGFGAHFVLEKAFNRSVDRELEIFLLVFDSKFKSLLKTSSKVNINEQKLWLDMSPIFKKDYCIRFVNTWGKTINTVGDCPDKFPTKLNDYDEIRDLKSELYHLHLLALKTDSGENLGYLQVGRSLEKLNYYMESLHLLLIVGVPLTMVLIGVGSWHLAGLAMYPIQQSYEQIQRFTSDVSHELRTPITSAQTLIETTLDNPLFLDDQQNLQSIYRQIKRLGELTTDLLLLSRLEQNPLQEIKWQKICLNDLVQDVEEELMSMAISAHISLVCDIQSEKLLYIHGNEGQIYRLLINLMTNGIKYTPENGEVKIILKAEYSKAIIMVKDTGIGISQNDIPHIFDRFYRVNDDRSRNTGGNGLGLSIAKAIALSHQGNLQVESKLGEGSSFMVIFPLLMIYSHFN